MWWINRTLHLFGWAIVFEYNENKELERVCPARTKFRGFSTESEEEGFIVLTKYLSDNIKELDKF